MSSERAAPQSDTTDTTKTKMMRAPPQTNATIIKSYTSYRFTKSQIQQTHNQQTYNIAHNIVQQLIT